MTIRDVDYSRTPFGKRSPLAHSADAVLQTLEDELDADDSIAPLSMAPGDIILLRVPDGYTGQRLDKVLAQLCPEFSRSRLQQWIDVGAVRINDRLATVREPVFTNDALQIAPQVSAEQTAYAPEALLLDVRYEDATLAIINKPTGLVVHPAAGNWSGTLLNGLLHRYPETASLPRAGIVHRLDKETTGLMVVARTLQAQTDLVRQLQARTVSRSYLAFVWGEVPSTGMINAPIGRDPRERTRMAIVRGANGKPARTRFTRLGSVQLEKKRVSFVRCDLETGRTHQIRVHMQSIGHPLVGDPVYHQLGKGVSERALPLSFTRQALHAWRLSLIHPASGETVTWTAEPPADFETLRIALNIDDGLEVD